MSFAIGTGDSDGTELFGGAIFGGSGSDQETARWQRMLQTIRRRQAWAADESEVGVATLAAENERLRAGVVTLAELLVRKGVLDEAEVGQVLAAIAAPEARAAADTGPAAEPTSADLDELGRLARVAER